MNVGNDTEKLIAKCFHVERFDMNWEHPKVDSPQGLATWFMYSNQREWKLPFRIGNMPYVVYIKYKLGDPENHCRVGYTNNGLCQRDRAYLHSYYPRYSRVRHNEALTVENTDSCIILYSNNKTNLNDVMLLEEMLIRDFDPSYNTQRPTKLIKSGLYDEIMLAA